MKYNDLKLTERKEIAAPSYLDGVDLSMLNRGMHTGFFPDVCVMITAYAYNLDKVLGCIPGSARTTDPKTWKKKYLDGHRPS